MKDATKMTPKELRELADKIEKDGLLSTVPRPLATRSDYSLVGFAEEIIQKMVDGTYHEDNNDEHWAFEELMTYVYGPAIWDWINAQNN